MDIRYGGLFGLVVFILDVIAIVEVLKSNRDTVSKLLWILLILMLPLLGLLIYYLAGRKV